MNSNRWSAAPSKQIGPVNAKIRSDAQTRRRAGMTVRPRSAAIGCGFAMRQASMPRLFENQASGRDGVVIGRAILKTLIGAMQTSPTPGVREDHSGRKGYTGLRRAVEASFPIKKAADASLRRTPAALYSKPRPSCDEWSRWETSADRACFCTSLFGDPG